MAKGQDAAGARRCQGAAAGAGHDLISQRVQVHSPWFVAAWRHDWAHLLERKLCGNATVLCHTVRKQIGHASPVVDGELHDAVPLLLEA